MRYKDKAFLKGLKKSKSLLKEFCWSLSGCIGRWEMRFVPLASSQIHYRSSAIRRSSVEKPGRIELRRADCPSAGS